MTSTDAGSKRVLVINGSYRDSGVTDQLLEAGVETEVVNLCDYPIKFCLNGRECCDIDGAQAAV